MLSHNEHLSTLIHNKGMNSSTQPKQSYVFNRRQLTQMYLWINRMIVFATENRLEIGIFKLRRNILTEVSTTVPYVCGGKSLNCWWAYLILNSHVFSPGW